jgi:hypothetical protein
VPTRHLDWPCFFVALINLPSEWMTKSTACRWCHLANCPFCLTCLKSVSQTLLDADIDNGCFITVERRASIPFGRSSVTWLCRRRYNTEVSTESTHKNHWRIVCASICMLQKPFWQKSTVYTKFVGSNEGTRSPSSAVEMGLCTQVQLHCWFMYRLTNYEVNLTIEPRCYTIELTTW